MRKREATLRHRGYVYAQGRLHTFIHETPDEITKRRMVTAEDWRNGYLAAMRDVARRARIARVIRGKT